MRGEPSPSASKAEPAIRIRPAVPQDRSFVRALALEVFSIYGSYDSYLTDWFDMDEVQTWIGEIDGERVGLMMLVPRPHPWKTKEAVADLLAIAVSPSHQTRGVGTELLSKAIEEARTLPAPFPIREMHLSVAETNARAQRLFSRRGFRIISGHGIYPAGQRAFHMVKVLAKLPAPRGEWE